MAHDVFISYSSKNKNTADAICHVLEEHKIRCWIAPRNIVVGEKYGNVIEEAIRNSKIFIIIFSKESSVSLWVESELNLAFTDRKIIMPFRIDDTNLEGEMRLILNNKHWIDAYPEPELKFKDLIEAVARSIGKPILNKVDKHNEEVQKQLKEERKQFEIENNIKPNKLFHNEKIDEDRGKSDTKSEVVNNKSMFITQIKKTSFMFAILVVVFVGIILLLVYFSNNRENLDLTRKDSSTDLIDSIALKSEVQETIFPINNNQGKNENRSANITYELMNNALEYNSKNKTIINTKNGTMVLASSNNDQENLDNISINKIEGAINENKTLLNNVSINTENKDLSIDNAPSKNSNKDNSGDGLMGFSFKGIYIMKESAKEKIEMAEESMKNKNYSKAIFIYKELIKEYPKDPEPYKLLEKAYRKYGILDKADSIKFKRLQIELDRELNALEVLKSMEKSMKEGEPHFGLE